jgi:hypothetical protein
MTKAILFTAAFAIALPAQNNFQNSAWIGGANPQPRLEGQAGPVTGKPFSGVETRQSKVVLSDGTPTNKTTTSKIYRDAEGRMRSESSNTSILFDAPNLTNYDITSKGCTTRSVNANQSVIIAATDNGTHTSSFSTSTSSSKSTKPASKVTSEDLGIQTINGISTKGTRQTLTIPAQVMGSDHDIIVVNERWYSDELGVLVRSSNVDPRFGSTTYDLTNINLSTPPASLFVAPTGCTESPMTH